MMQDPEQQNRIERRDRVDMPLRETFAMKLSSACILLSSIVNAALLGVETYVVDMRHEVSDVTGATAQVEYAFAGLEFGEAIQAESS